MSDHTFHLSVGQRVLYDGDIWSVTALSGQTVQLARPVGSPLVMRVSDLLAGPGFGVAGDTQPLALETDVATQPMSLDDKSPERRKTDALALIGQHHPKVVAAIQATWGFKECAAYLNKLVLNGSDDSGHSRLGFSPQVIEALMGLTQLHEVQFGQLDKPEELGFGDYSVRAGLDGAR